MISDRLFLDPNFTVFRFLKRETVSFIVRELISVYPSFIEIEAT